MRAWKLGARRRRLGTRSADRGSRDGYAPFFATVKKTGFRGGLSIEGRGTFEADAVASLAFFRKELA